MTVAGMFDKRFDTFLKDVILSEAQPIGNVLDYFYRADSNSEACLFGVNDAPEHGFSSNKEVVPLFINTFLAKYRPNKKTLHSMK